MNHAPSALERLRAELEEGPGLLAEALAPLPDGGAGGVFGPMLEAVDRLEGRPENRAKSAYTEYELVLESVFEGYLLHYARGRLIATDDRDLRLLAGDYMYAVGLDCLARLNDIDAVRELADLITLSARLHSLTAIGEPDRHWEAIRALWGAAALAIAGGRWDAHGRVKQLARQGDATSELLDVTRARAAELGVGPALERALIAFDETVEAVDRTT